MISFRGLRAIFTAVTCAGFAIQTHQALAQTSEFRPPAVPLVTADPYLSVWSMADKLTDDDTRHWTHRPQPLRSLIRIDGSCFRLMGKSPAEVPALPQLGLTVTPSRSIYEFGNGAVHVTLSFLTAAMPDDLNVLTRPLTYIEWNVRSIDGQKHSIEIYDSASSALSVNSPDQRVVWGRELNGGLAIMHVGTSDQPILQRSGDDTRIDWGYAYLAAGERQCSAAIGSDRALLDTFVQTGKLGNDVDSRMPRAVSDDEPTMAVALHIGEVDAKPVLRHVIVAYDEIYSIKYFGQKLRPYWRRNGATAESLLRDAEHDFDVEAKQCEIFDKLLDSDLQVVGGPKYAQIASLAYRQALAATGIAADSNKQPLLFTKENTSNGDIATVDVIFPMDPMLILFNPTLAKASIVPILSYADSDHWRFPNAPHDLGTYPIARGTDDGGEGMPVEESGNMLILCDAISQSENDARFLNPWWPKLTQWAKYLESYGLDPEDQLCTDDFMGHLAHNANLSIKAILGLAAYGDLCRMRGDVADSERYQTIAKNDAAHWISVADEGDHSLLAFDKPGTWSQKYNLVWDRILNLNVFPTSVAEKEVAFYKTKLLQYGLPLDSRTHLTKTDWSFWSATLSRDLGDFDTLTSPIYDYLNHTTAREPLVDSYVTDKIASDGMHARPVVGGIFIKMLADRPTWRKWIEYDDKEKPGPWAPLPTMPKLVEVIPSGKASSVSWRTTTSQPPTGWEETDFDDSKWTEGVAPFGTAGTPGIRPKTVWKTDDIWLRREVTVPEYKGDLLVYAYHDEDLEVYVDGVLAAKEGGFITDYDTMDIAPAAKAKLKPGSKVTVAVHCHQTVGGQGVDVGFAVLATANR